MSDKKIKLQIKSWVNGSVLFEYESVDNTMAKTVSEAIKRYADLSNADLSNANLRYANLRYANLRYANLSYADLSYADLSNANLSNANLSNANLRGIPFNQLPEYWVNLCSRDILFVLEHLKGEVPYLKQSLLEGKVDGSQYQGECACLVGTLANSKKEDYEKLCTVIPYYTPDTSNPGEQWFLNISEGDTPKDNIFSEHAVKLCNRVLGLPELDGIEDEETKSEPESINIGGTEYEVTDELKETLKNLKEV